MQTATAAFVAARAERSIHLLEGLQAALIVLGHPDLARIAEMVRDDASAARGAVQFQRETHVRTRKRAVLEDLKTLAQAAGATSLHQVIRAGRLVARM